MAAVMYPLANQEDYTELKYSLRSVDKYMPDAEVIIVGDNLPLWINNVTQIVVPDIPGRKQLSIKRKIISALGYAERFLFMNDDVYLLAPTGDEPPYCYWNDLHQYHAEGGSKILLDQLVKMGKPTKNFDGHYPLAYDRKFLSVCENFHADGIIKSMFCNYLGIEGVFLADNKVIARLRPEQIKAFISGRSSFSTGPNSLSSCIQVLQELFPEPSKFEIV